jgi:hypothetical protein
MLTELSLSDDEVCRRLSCVYSQTGDGKEKHPVPTRRYFSVELARHAVTCSQNGCISIHISQYDRFFQLHKAVESGEIPGIVDPLHPAAQNVQSSVHLLQARSSQLPTKSQIG